MRRLLTLFALIAVLMMGTTALAQDITIEGGDEAQLRNFLQRLVGYPGPQGPDVSILVADTPDLPFALPLPADINLIGSVVRSGIQAYGTGDATFTEVYFNTSAMPPAVLEFFRGALTNSGWNNLDQGQPPQGGFAPASNAYGNFCLNDEANLNFDAFSPDMETTYVSVRIQYPADPYMCNQPDQTDFEDPYRMLPALQQPSGVTVDPMMGGGLNYYSPNGPSASLPAILISDMGADEIAAAYAQQLQSLGWTQLTSTGTPAIARSTWSWTSERGTNWIGTLIIAETSDPDDGNRYDAVIALQSNGVG